MMEMWLPLLIIGALLEQSTFCYWGWTVPGLGFMWTVQQRCVTELFSSCGSRWHENKNSLKQNTFTRHRLCPYDKRTTFASLVRIYIENRQRKHTPAFCFIFILYSCGYMIAVFNPARKLSFKNYDERRASAEKICREAEQMHKLFKDLAPKLVWSY